MKHSTPFLPPLCGWLFGRPSRSVHARLQAEVQRIRQASLGQLAGLFDQYIHQPLLNPDDSGAGSRQRLFSTRTTFWAFLSQVLSPAGSCREAVRKVQAWQAAEGGPRADSGTSGYCQARGRLSIRKLRTVHVRAAQEVGRRSSSRHNEFGRPIKIVDGTGVSMPDTPANQSVWPQTQAQKPGCGFPFARLVGLFTLANGVLIDWVEGSKHDHESKLFRRLWDRLQCGDVLLGDRGFCSYATLAALLQRGIDSVMRIHHARGFSFSEGNKLGPQDRLTRWEKPVKRLPGWSEAEWKALPETLSLRLVEIRVRVPGFRVRNYVIVTTLLDPIEWSVERLGQLYFRRWSVELFFRDIKTTLGMDILRCQSPDMVQKEIIMHAIAYNCIRGVMQHVATLYDVPLERISFKGTVDTLRHWAGEIGRHADKPRKQAAMINALFQIIAEDPVPHRPNRCEPRAKKRRPKGYQLMNKPRRKMAVSPSRRWK